MGNELHEYDRETDLIKHGKRSVFVIVPDNFPLHEDGLIGREFLEKYQFSLTNEHLRLDDITYPLEDSGYVVPPRSNKTLHIPQKIRKANVVITNHELIPEGLNKVHKNQLRIPIDNQTNRPLIIWEDKIKTERVNTAHANQKRIPPLEITKRITTLMENTRLNHVEDKIRPAIEQLITQYHDVFCLPNDPLPCSPDTEHVIRVKDNKPINNIGYRPPEVHREEIKRQTNEMLDKGIIRPSKSPYNSPIWVVPKKPDASGKKKWRIVIDYRKLNDKTDQDAYPLPVIDDILDHLGKAKFFSAFDLSSGFHQIPMEPESKKYTAFSTPEGHFEYNRMPFGLKNAPATFQRMMDTALRGLIGKHCFVYLDDIVIYGKTYQEHNENLQILFERLRQVGLKLQPDKCEYIRPELEYLGHLITKDGVKPNPKKISAVQNFKQPTNVTEVKSFLGLVGYYRKFIRNFSTISKPLTNLTKKETEWQWTDKCTQAFTTLRSALCKEPVLRYPDYAKEFVLTTDASNVGIGAVLSQEGHPCCYISSTLDKAQQNYTTTEKELLAIVWSIKRLRQYLLGRRFKIQTDHKALVWLFNVKDPSSRLLRWRLKLEEYDFYIEHKKGRENGAADALSRVFATRESEELEPETEGSIEPKEPEDLLTPEQIYSEYTAWGMKGYTEDRIKYLKNTNKGLWTNIRRDRTPGTQNDLELSDYDEKDWVNDLYLGIKFRLDNQQKPRFSLSDPTFTIYEKEAIKDMLNFLSGKVNKKIRLCRALRELTPEEKLTILKENHGSELTHHFGENKSLERLRENYE